MRGKKCSIVYRYSLAVQPIWFNPLNYKVQWFNHARHRLKRDVPILPGISRIVQCVCLHPAHLCSKMAEGLCSGYDPLFTMDVVRDFMLANGGKVSNHTLVTHFKSFLNDSQRKNANRQMFKQYVNTLAVVKLDVSGEKLLVLKKKFRDSGSFRGEPVAAKCLPSDQDRVKAKRAKTEDVQTTQATDVESLNDDKENLRKTTSGNVPDLPVDDVSTEDGQTDEELEMSTEHDVGSIRPYMPDELGQSSDSVDIEHTDVTEADTSASTEISATENMDDGLCTFMLHHYLSV